MPPEENEINEKTENNEANEFNGKNDFSNDTPVGAPLKEKYRMETKKLREMPFKKKMEYIWDYYKIPIIATIVILFIAGSLINTIFINPRPQTALFIAWEAGFVMEEQFAGLEKVLQEQIVTGYRNERVETTQFFDMAGDPSVNAMNIQRLAAMVAAGMIDIFIVDPQGLEEHSYNGIIQPMDAVLAEVRTINPAVYSRLEEKLVKAVYRPEGGTEAEHIMGVDLTDNRLLDDLGFFEFERYFSVSVTSGNIQNVVKALIILFE